ncbi:hypothetical protein BJ138DRAFT_167834 [Hygrophoropsis aurantiaca]|uniref:Uncharacterized protein n=1 Tax=Hygrophoropsis aurantiaca TaxID=72124 RepID=A0ACB8AB70_9AGAM|nr:hypothetical protein BJ138DRAFT_167834 [Hygrophoropsis aurantiaca]
MASFAIAQVFWPAAQQERIYSLVTFALKTPWIFLKTRVNKQAIPDLLQIALTLYSELRSREFKLVPMTSLFLLVCTSWSYFVLSTRNHTRRRRENVAKTRSALEALLTIICPSCSLWPKRYTKLAQAASLSGRESLSLPLSALMDDIYAGTIELRDPIGDLPSLLDGNTRVYAWAVKIQLGYTRCFMVLDWLVFMKYGKQPALGSTTSPELGIGPLENIVLPLVCDRTEPVHNLDMLPYVHITQFIQHLKTKTHNPTGTSNNENTTIIEFTTLSPGISFLSTTYIAATIPFLPRKHTRACHPASANGVPDLPQRTTTSLLISLEHVIEVLKLQSPKPQRPLTIDTVTNVSKEYAGALVRAHDALEEDSALRQSFVESWGQMAWREHRFLLAWEAALFENRSLERWVVVVHT